MYLPNIHIKGGSQDERVRVQGTLTLSSPSAHLSICTEEYRGEAPETPCCVPFGHLLHSARNILIFLQSLPQGYNYILYERIHWKFLHIFTDLVSNQERLQKKNLKKFWNKILIILWSKCIFFFCCSCVCVCVCVFTKLHLSSSIQGLRYTRVVLSLYLYLSNFSFSWCTFLAIITSSFSPFQVSILFWGKPYFFLYRSSKFLFLFFNVPSNI